MGEKEKYIGLTIGIIYTLCCLLLVNTLIPLLSVLPGILLGEFFSNFPGILSGKGVGRMATAILSAGIIIYTILCVKDLRKRVAANEPVTKTQITAFLFFFYLLIHPLGFYLYWGIALNYRNDGQLLLLGDRSFLYSSFSFMIFGALMDYVILSTSRKREKRSALDV